jgi:hypothetical protein
MDYLGAGPKSGCSISGAEISGLFTSGSVGEINWVRFSIRRTVSRLVSQSVSYFPQLRREGSIYWGLELSLRMKRNPYGYRPMALKA